MKLLLEVEVPDRKVKELICRANPGSDMKIMSLSCDAMKISCGESVRFTVEHTLTHIFGVADVVIKT